MKRISADGWGILARACTDIIARYPDRLQAGVAKILSQQITHLHQVAGDSAPSPQVIADNLRTAWATDGGNGGNGGGVA